MSTAEIGPAEHVVRPMTKFQKVILAFALLLHLPWAAALAHLVTPRFGHTPALAGVAVLTLVSLRVFWGRARWVMDDAPRNELHVELVDMPYFVHLAALVLGFVPALVVGALGLFGRVGPGALGWLYGGAYVLAAYGVYVRRAHFVVRERDVVIPGLPADLDGLRMAHLSDLHIGGLMQKRRAMRWIYATNRIAPDLVVLTGDYVTSGVAFHEDIAQVIGSLKAPLGVFASLGNHDYFGGGEPMITLLRERGVKVLRNQGELVERGSDRLFLGGADDVWTRRADVDKTLEDWDGTTPCILLAHDPDLFVKAAARGVQLTLSGHTHAGQLAIPFLSRWLSLSHVAHRFHQGFYQKGSSRLYVSPGLGTTGLPLRIGTVPTIAVHVLRSGKPTLA